MYNTKEPTLKQQKDRRKELKQQVVKNLNAVFESVPNDLSEAANQKNIQKIISALEEARQIAMSDLTPILITAREVKRDLEKINAGKMERPTFASPPAKSAMTQSEPHESEDKGCKSLQDVCESVKSDILRNIHTLQTELEKASGMDDSMEKTKMMQEARELIKELEQINSTPITPISACPP